MQPNQNLFSSNLSKVVLAVNRGGDINAVDEAGFTPLIHAVCYGASDVVKFFIAHGASDQSDYAGRSAVVHAARNAHEEILAILLEAGYGQPCDNDGRTALMAAVQTGSVNCIELLFRYGATDERDHLGRRAMHYAILAQPVSVTVIQCLIDHNCQINPADHEGNTPLHLLTQNRSHHDKHALEVLLEAGGDPAALNHLGESPAGNHVRNQHGTFSS
jgi:ankyrin repeat protein